MESKKILIIIAVVAALTAIITITTIYLMSYGCTTG